MKDRNRLRTPLAPQGCGGPGTPGDFARSGYRYRARSVRSLRHPTHPVGATRHSITTYIPPPLPISNRTQKAPQHRVRASTKTAAPPKAPPPPHPPQPPTDPASPHPKRPSCQNKINMQMRERREEKQPLCLKWNANKRCSRMGVIK